MLSTLISFALGVWAAQQQAHLVAHAGVLFSLTLVGGVIAIANARRAADVSVRWTTTACAMSIAFLLAFTYTHWRATERLTHALAPSLEGVPLVVEGVIATLPDVSESGVRFVFEIERTLAPLAAMVPPRVSLAWVQSLRGDEIPAVHAGERWRLAVRLRQPHGFANPHGFDLEAWLLERNIRATGSVSVLDPSNQRLSADAGRWHDRVARWREAARSRIIHTLDGARWTGVIVALAIGDQSSIANADWSTFATAGIAHLLSISGAHVTLFAAAVAAAVFGAWRRSRRLTLAWPARKAAMVAAIIATFIYAVFSGFSVPAQRTCWMVAVAGLALMRSEHARASVVLALAFVGVLIVDPWAILSPGFWFSFGAVACLLWGAAYRVGARPWWKTALVVQTAIFVAALPIGLALFQQVSLIGIAINTLAIPLVSFVVVPLSLLWLIVPWSGFLWVAHGAFDALARVCEWAVNAPGAVWQQHAPAAWTIVLATLGAFWLIGPRAMPGKAFAVALMLPLFSYRPERPAEGTFTVTALDVGQGLAVVVQTKSYDLLYDAGPKWTDESDAGQRIVVPYLRATGARLGALIVSHQDSDHAGGAAAVMRERAPDWVMSSFEASTIPRAVRCHAGQTWTWDQVRFEVIHPERYDDARVQRSNDISCVVRVTGADGSTALLTGDIEALAEHALLSRRADLHAELMTMPHHGSTTSSTDEFIDAVSPKVVVVNAGYRNRFGHPRSNVLEKYLRRNITVDRTDLHGAVFYRWQERHWVAQRWRTQHVRYWHHRPHATASPL